MSNPSKKKGTSGETEVLARLHHWGFRDAVRNPASATFDITSPAKLGETMNILATRPDRGRWLATVDLEQLLYALSGLDTEYDLRPELHVEVKRYARFALHTIFEGKFK